MGYAVLVLLLIIVVYLYAITKGQLSQVKSELSRKETIIDNYERVQNNLYKEQNESYIQQKEDFAFVIKNQISLVQKKGLYSSYDPEDLCRMIIDNGYIIGVDKIQDIDFDKFEKTIKAALYADKGYLQAWQSDSTQLFRTDQYGKHIPLTDEELNKLKNHDFDFIFDSLQLF